MNFEVWGEIPYKVSTERQLDLVNLRAEDKIEDTIIFCYHPKVVTLGRGTDPEDITTWKGEVESSSRGGRATYHGPGQLVIYPIIKLKELDIMKYLDWLEELTVNALKDWGVHCQKSREAHPEIEKKEPNSPTQIKRVIPTGVWVENRKIASIGVAIKKRVTYHGIAINLYEDPDAFTGINPCGFSTEVMTSLEKETHKKVARDELIKTIISKLR